MSNHAGSKYEYLIGQKIGKLTVLEYIGNSKFKCQCECGNITIAGGGSLANGTHKSCKCERSNRALKDDLSGHTFGCYTVIRPLKRDKPYRGHYLLWECRCKYGNIHKVTTSHLKGRRNTCNCAETEGTALYQFDKGLQANNTTGYKGVTYNKRQGKYMAYISLARKKIHLGYFSSAEAAAKARAQAEIELVDPIRERMKEKEVKVE